MASELTVLPLEDCLDALIDYRGKTPRKTNHGIPLITAKVVKSGRIETPDEFIAEEDYASWMTRGLPRIGDVVLTTEAPLGEVAQIKFLPVALAQRIVTLRGKPGLLDNCYLLYLLQSQEMQEKLVGRSSGTTVIGIKQSELRKIELALPPISEQRAIAHILGTLDDKIELNRKQNETLEAMARALFKAWFVDFEPVRAKMEGRWQRGQSLPGLPAHLYDLFPDRLVESELGEIPEGWETKRVSDYLSLAYGKSLPAGKRQKGIYPVYGSGGLVGFHNEAMINGPTVIVGRKGTVGSLYWEDRPCFPIDTVFYVQPKVPLSFCYYLLKALPLKDMNTDAAVPGLNRENVYRLEVAAPPRELVSHFAETTSRFRESIAVISRSSEALSQLRDTILPKLISGELRVSKLEI
ncbi:restriction endonuclease subunit S [Pseudoxanthomonas sp. SGD-10]|nr:restriction endonuclease subunit S [Pseudoxanthomonas sp. SGD-10]